MEKIMAFGLIHFSKIKLEKNQVVLIEMEICKKWWGKIGFGISATGAPSKDGKGKAHLMA